MWGPYFYSELHNRATKDNERCQWICIVILYSFLNRSGLFYKRHVLLESTFVTSSVAGKDLPLILFYILKRPQGTFVDYLIFVILNEIRKGYNTKIFLKILFSPQRSMGSTWNSEQFTDYFKVFKLKLVNSKTKTVCSCKIKFYT